MPRPRTIAPWTLRRRWTADEARAALEHLAASGLSITGFSRGHGLDPQRLRSWRRKLAATSAHATPATTAAPPAPMFVEVPRRVPAPIEIVLRGGIVVRVAESVDPRAVRRLVDALDEEVAC